MEQELNHYDIKRLGLILAIQAQVDGMKADNENRKQNGEAMSYTMSDFQEKSDELYTTVHLHDHQM